MEKTKLEKIQITAFDPLGIETMHHSRADYFRLSIGFSKENQHHVNIAVGTSAEHVVGILINMAHSISWFQIRNGDKK